MSTLEILGAALLIAGSIFGHGLLVSHRQQAAAEPTPATEPQPEPEPEQPFNMLPLAVLTPDDPCLPDDEAAHIAAAVARAVDDYASHLVAVDTGLDPQTCLYLLDQAHDRLREDLTPQQLARAVVMGLHPHAAERAEHLTAQFRTLPTHSQES